MKEAELKYLEQLGWQAQEKMDTYLLYTDTIHRYLQQHDKIDPETDNVVMRMLSECQRKVVVEIITILEETERHINSTDEDIDKKIEQLGLVCPFLELFKKDYELIMSTNEKIMELHKNIAYAK